MLFRSDDPVRDAERHDRYQTRQQEKFPLCECCDQRIAEGYYFTINGEILCLDCVTEEYGKRVEE